jgi:hypothetical protein
VRKVVTVRRCVQLFLALMVAFFNVVRIILARVSFYNEAW